MFLRIRDKHFICRWTAHVLRVAGLGALARALITGLNQERPSLSGSNRYRHPAVSALFSEYRNNYCGLVQVKSLPPMCDEGSRSLISGGLRTHATIVPNTVMTGSRLQTHAALTMATK